MHDTTLLILRLLHLWGDRLSPFTHVTPSAAKQLGRELAPMLQDNSEAQTVLTKSLWDAARTGHGPYAEFLLSAGANPNRESPGPVFEAARTGYRELLRLFLRNRANPVDALCGAVAGNNAGLAAAMLRLCANRSDAATAAIEFGANAEAPVLRLLLSKGAQVEKHGVEALTGAVQRGDEEAFVLLADAYQDDRWAQGFILVIAATNGNLSIIRHILAHRRTVQDIDLNLLGAIESCYEYHRLEALRELFCFGGKAQTWLSLAASERGDFALEALQMLLGLEVDPAAIDPRDFPMFTNDADPEILSCLLAHGLPPEACAPESWTIKRDEAGVVVARRIP